MDIGADHPIVRLVATIARLRDFVSNEADRHPKDELLRFGSELEKAQVRAEAWATKDRLESLRSGLDMINLRQLTRAARMATTPQGIDARLLERLRGLFPNPTAEVLLQPVHSDTEVYLFLGKALLEVLLSIPIGKHTPRAVREILESFHIESSYRLGDPNSPMCQLLSSLSKVGPVARGQGNGTTAVAPFQPYALRSKMKALFPEVHRTAWVSWENKGTFKTLAREQGGVGSDLYYHVSRVRERLLKYRPKRRELPKDWVLEVDRRISAAFGGS